MDTDIQRLKRAVNYLIYKEVAETESDLAKRLNCTKSYFSQVMNGKAKISDNFVERLCSLDRDLNKVYITTGEGELLTSQTIDGDNNTQVRGDGNKVTTHSSSSLDKALDEIGEMRKALTEAMRANQEAMRANQENTSRLLGILENMSGKQESDR